MGGCFGGRRPVGKPIDRWEDVVWRDAIGLFQVRKWKTENLKKTEDAMPQKLYEAPQKKRKYTDIQKRRV
jgi:hypothetical protein